MLFRSRNTQRRQRERRETFNISLVGYTNAGKSTLFNALVKARAYAADQLFATLDTTTRQLYLSEAVARAGVTRVDEVPVVDALAATLKMAEAMGDLKKLGISVTRRGYTHARPPRELIDHVRRTHGRAPITREKE